MSITWVIKGYICLFFIYSNLVLDIFHIPVYIINNINVKNRYLVLIYLFIWQFEFLK